MTVLCPVDFSSSSAALVGFAATLAAAAGSELWLLHVCEPAEAGATPPDCPAHLARLQAAAGAGRGPHVSTGVLRGEAAAAIVAEAARRRADLIVIGAHGQTGLSRFLMGNTAEAVLRTAPCPTLLVREPAGK